MWLYSKELRLKYGLSQQDITNKTGIPKGRINGWDQGKGKPKQQDYVKLKAFFDSLEKAENQFKNNLSKQDTSIPRGTLVEEPRPLNYSKSEDAEVKALLREQIRVLTAQVDDMREQHRDLRDQNKELRKRLEAAEASADKGGSRH